MPKVKVKDFKLPYHLYTKLLRTILIYGFYGESDFPIEEYLLVIYGKGSDPSIQFRARPQGGVYRMEVVCVHGVYPIICKEE